MNLKKESGADIDGSEHYHTEKDQIPSLLTVILDTNPRAWAALSRTLPQDKAVANILAFLNIHLSYSSLHQVAVIASHPTCAKWLYPSPPPPPGSDVEMRDGPPSSRKADTANKYDIFSQVEIAVISSLRRLNEASTSEDLGSTNTQMSGALTLALAHTNKANTLLLANMGGADSGGASGGGTGRGNSGMAMHALNARILIISVSDASPSQYIATMNSVFAASHAKVSIDVLALRGDTACSRPPPATTVAPAFTNSSNGVPAAVEAASGRTTFLQQAADITGGTYLSVPNAVDAAGLLSFLMFGFADSETRRGLIPPTQDSVDFRAACFCHRRVIATGFVCSICLSIFCSIPAEKAADISPGNAVECLTCGSNLVLGFYGDKPAVIPRRKRKRKRGVNGVGREESGSLAGTPRPGQ
ncbi:General transcription and DNA repair factor IIH subunit tfb4 like protein [Zalerion maritima]|uniref:General transcription and DNA repair factor IIH subunit TFB4 n=1 Tax=Zalerion maritima TaxID=339359 RepID=A0AAD5RNQ2_9PEZI|nr:General transcription and DNA repair factor IIH subunit tfb4 like protein [Zalerion maritima]